MKELFIPYTEALELKELGFDEPCLGYWRNENVECPLTIGQHTTKQDMEDEISGRDELHNYKNIIALAPSYQQAFKWFREKHKLPSEVRFVANLEVYDYRITKIGVEYTNSFYDGVRPTSAFKTYEEAELATLRKLIQLMKKQQP